MKKIKLSNKVKEIISIIICVASLVAVGYSISPLADDVIMPIVGLVGIITLIFSLLWFYDIERDGDVTLIDNLYEKNLRLLNLWMRSETENHDTLKKLYEAVKITDYEERLEKVIAIIDEDKERVRKRRESMENC